jgi:hypothetical protein
MALQGRGGDHGREIIDLTGRELAGSFREALAANDLSAKGEPGQRESPALACALHGVAAKIAPTAR